MENQAKMKKNFLVILLLILTLSAFGQQKKVAVYVTGQQTGINKVLGDQLVAAFAKSGRYIAVERTASFIAELGKELQYQQSGAVSDNEIAQLGVQFGVDYVCVADLADVFGEKYISARLIDVETAEIVNTHAVNGAMNNMEDCLNLAGQIAANLTKGTFAEQDEDRLLLEVRQKREKEELKQKLKEEGFVDLGLPSGTWWKNQDEKELYSQDMAIDMFGDYLPTAKQCEELANFCKLSNRLSFKEGNRIRYYYILTGPNGNSIRVYLGHYEGNGNLRGCFWSSTKPIDCPFDVNCAYVLNLYQSSGMSVSKYNNRCEYRYPVRLVRVVK